MREFWFTPKFNRFDWYGMMGIVILAVNVPFWYVIPLLAVLSTISNVLEKP